MPERFRRGSPTQRASWMLGIFFGRVVEVVTEWFVPQVGDGAHDGEDGKLHHGGDHARQDGIHHAEIIGGGHNARNLFTFFGGAYPAYPPHTVENFPPFFRDALWQSLQRLLFSTKYHNIFNIYFLDKYIIIYIYL